MRDVTRTRERRVVTLDRIQMVWLTLGAVVGLGLMFALGLVVGQRAAGLADRQSGQSPIAQIDAEGKILDELTFYERLAEPTPTSPALPNPPPDSVAQPQKTSVEAAPGPVPSPAGAAERAAADSALSMAMTAGPPPSGDYTVQVSAFQSVAEAKAFSASLERKGFQPFVVSADVRGKGTWYRVRLGSFENKELAEQAKRLLAQANIPAWVLKAE